MTIIDRFHCNYSVIIGKPLFDILYNILHHLCYDMVRSSPAVLENVTAAEDVKCKLLYSEPRKTAYIQVGFLVRPHIGGSCCKPYMIQIESKSSDAGSMGNSPGIVLRWYCSIPRT